MRKQWAARQDGRLRSILQKALLVCTLVLTMGAAVGCAIDRDDGRDGSPIEPTPSVTRAPDDGTATSSIGPDGFAGLRLGMSVDEVRDTGEAALHEDVGGRCLTFALTGAGLPAAETDSETDGFVSKEHGLVAVFARPGMRTPEGLGVGSTVAELRAAYAAGDSESGWFRVSLGGGREYEFGVGHGNTVESLSIRMIMQDCFS